MLIQNPMNNKQKKTSTDNNNVIIIAVQQNIKRKWSMKVKA